VLGGRVLIPSASLRDWLKAKAASGEVFAMTFLQIKILPK